MAKPITHISNPEPTEQEQQDQALEHVIHDLAQNAEGIREAIKLLQQLQESGILGALNAVVEAKDKVAKIAVGQLVRPPVTNAINNAMAAAGALTELDPEMTKKLLGGVANGLQKAEQGLQNDERTGMFQLLKALRDPDINRAIGFGLNLLKGIGEGLKK
ncbi:DUF1641 domain-containing protein [Paenibacillus caui]|uniref:DUF1641 domain-containing protein n=1 Tax=Paenibacillus caui TaxID=2873927 RepID=UPI001CAA3536|nr:DUF1641 domain-containing protein [Paenibacillus caui]